MALVEAREEGPRTRAQKVYKENDPVVARYTRKSLWYAATVMNVRDDGMIKIKWLDGDKTDTLKSKADVLPASRIVSATPQHLLSQRRCTEGGGGGESPAFAAAMKCSSCASEEIEILQCAGCAALFCFGCSSISVSTLPDHSWCCATCVGSLEDYDEQRWRLIETARSRVAEGRVGTTELHRFSQLVFDLRNSCNWSAFQSCISTLIDYSSKQLEQGQVPAIAPFHALNYADSGVSKLLMRRIAEAYANETRERAGRISKINLTNNPGFKMWKDENIAFSPSTGTRRLRIGYLSADFVDHPTADLIQSALLKHDKSRFEIFLYSISRNDESEYRRRLKEGVEHFVHFSQRTSDFMCADVISKDGIHILVNVNGHTSGERNGICALKPAPVQLVFLAYPGTMGANYMYNVVDKIVCPDDQRKFYTERMFYMPHCYQTNSFKDLYSKLFEDSKVPTRADHLLPAEPTFIFCNFCQLGRITSELFHTWMNILRRVPLSVLWLLRSSSAAEQRLVAAAVQHGIEPARLLFAPRVSPKVRHLQRAVLADVALDTLVYNGHTTSSDLLWSGVPVVTVRGDGWPSLVTASLAEAIGVREMVVSTLVQYEDLAVELANKPLMLKTLKKRIMEQRHSAPLFDTDRWIANFETGLQEAWRRHDSGHQGDDDIVVVDEVEVCEDTRKKSGGRDQIKADPKETRTSCYWDEELNDMEKANALPLPEVASPSHNALSRVTEQSTKKRKPARPSRVHVCEECNLSFVNAQALGGHRKHSAAHHARVLQLTAGPVESLLCPGSSSSMGETSGSNATTKKRARGSSANRVDTAAGINKDARHRESIFLSGVERTKAKGTHYNDAQRKVLMGYLHKERQVATYEKFKTKSRKEYGAIAQEINLLDSPGGTTGRPVTWRSIQHWFLNARKRTRGGPPAPKQGGMQSCSTKSAQDLSGDSVGEEEGNRSFEDHDNGEGGKFGLFSELEKLHEQVAEDEGHESMDSDEDEDGEELGHKAIVDQEAGERVSQVQSESFDLGVEDGFYWCDPSALR